MQSFLALFKVSFLLKFQHPQEIITRLELHQINASGAQSRGSLWIGSSIFLRSRPSRGFLSDLQKETENLLCPRKDYFSRKAASSS